MSDGHALYTPGLSENRNGTSVFYDFDRIGNLWTLDGAGKSQFGYIDFSGYGSVIAAAGTTSPFSFGGANGCQTDPDASLVMMGHRYYDPRTGRFISQDHAMSGRNWYTYAGNNPANKTDPSGLMPQMSLPEGSSPQGSPGYLGINAMAEVENAQQTEAYNQQVDEIHAANAFAMMSFCAQVLGAMGDAIVPQSNDYIISAGYGAEILLGTHKYSVSAGIAIDLSTRQYEGAFTVGHYQGFGIGIGSSPYFGLGLGTLGGYNGFSSGFNADGGEFGGIAYDYNAGYKGVTYMPDFLSNGLAARAFMGIPNGSNATRGGSFTFPTPTRSY